MRNSNFVYVFKMEYVPKIDIFGLKMMVTIHHKFFFEIPPCAKKDLNKRAGRITLKRACSFIRDFRVDEKKVL